MLQELWQYEVQVFPVLICFGIYELPTLLRRLKRTFYVPIYFSVYPLRHINQDLSVYLGEDFAGHGETLDSQKAEDLRRKIIFISVTSMTIDALAIPLFTGFLVSFFIKPDIFSQFYALLFFYKFTVISFSLKNSRHHFSPDQWKIPLLVFVYISYLGVVLEMLNTSYSWAYPFTTQGDWSGLWTAFSRVIFGQITGQWILLTLFVAIFTNYITDRKVKQENINDSPHQSKS